VHQRWRQRVRGEGDATDAVFAFSYGWVITAWLLLLFGLITVFIVPRYIEIFDDYDTGLPWISRVTFEAAGTLGYVPLVLAAAVLAGLAGWSLRTVSRPRSDAGDRGGWWGWLLEGLPGIGGVFRDRSWASGFEATAEALRAGHDLPPALRIGAGAAVGRRTRARLEEAADRLRDGELPGDAAASAGWPRLARGLFRAGGVGPGLFDFLAVYHRGRWERWAAWAEALLLPAVVTVLAVLAGWITLSLFLPLVELIRSVNEWHIL
jgi:type II secretory pathway component PulF